MVVLLVTARTERLTKTASVPTTQVEGVDEADVLTSNGVQAFAAYGHAIEKLDVAVFTRAAVSEVDTTILDCAGTGGSILGMLLTTLTTAAQGKELTVLLYSQV